MSWKKYFTPVNTENQSGSYSPISGGGRPGPARSNYSSYLPDVYAGSPNRIEKYMQYDTMDMDSEVNAALDILAEFCTGKDKENATVDFIETTSDFHKKMLPYADKSNLIAGILFYEETMKLLHEYNEVIE